MLFRDVKLTEETKELLSHVPYSKNGTLKINLVLVDTMSKLEAMVKSFGDRPVAFDIETTGLDINCELVGLSFCGGYDTAYYVPVGHTQGDFYGGSSNGQMGLNFHDTYSLQPNQLPIDKVREAVRPLFVDNRLIVHNGKFDLGVLYRYGFPVPVPLHDTLSGAWVLNAGAKFANNGLKQLASSKLKTTMFEITDLLGKGKNQITFDRVPIKTAVKYAADDAAVTYRLYQYQRVRLPNMNLHADAWDTLMKNHVAVVYMENAGVYTNRKAYDQLLEQVTLEIEQLTTFLLDGLSDYLYGLYIKFPDAFMSHMEVICKPRKGPFRFIEGKDPKATIHRLIHSHFNIKSNKQLSYVLFDVFSVSPDGVASNTTGYSVDKENLKTAYQNAMEQVASGALTDEIGDWFDKLSELNNVNHLFSNYVNPFPTLVQKDGRIYPHFNPHNARTGRFSSSEPNFQNVTVKDHFALSYRRCFVPEHGNVFLFTDYSQQELRVLALMSQDQTLIDAYLSGQDLHKVTAARVFDKPIDEISKNERKFTKTVNFGLIYGMSAYGLSHRLGITPDEAEKFIQTYFKALPGVQNYIEQCKYLSRNRHYVKTLLGFKKEFPIFKQPYDQAHQQLYERAYRQAMNFPIQGSSADMTKLAINAVLPRLADFTAYRNGKTVGAMLNSVIHDELVVEVKATEAIELGKIIQHEMEHVLDKLLQEKFVAKGMKIIPLVAEPELSPDWAVVKTEKACPSCGHDRGGSSFWYLTDTGLIEKESCHTCNGVDYFGV